MKGITAKEAAEAEQLFGSTHAVLDLVANQRSEDWKKYRSVQELFRARESAKASTDVASSEEK